MPVEGLLGFVALLHDVAHAGHDLCNPLMARLLFFLPLALLGDGRSLQLSHHFDRFFFVLDGLEFPLLLVLLVHLDDLQSFDLFFLLALFLVSLLLLDLFLELGNLLKLVAADFVQRGNTHLLGFELHHIPLHLLQLDELQMLFVLLLLLKYGFLSRFQQLVVHAALPILLLHHLLGVGVDLCLETARKFGNPPLLFVQGFLLVLEQLFVAEAADFAPEVVLQVAGHLDALAFDLTAELVRDLLHTDLHADVRVPLRVERDLAREGGASRR